MPNSKNEFLMIFIGEPAGEVILKSPFELFTMIFRHSEISQPTEIKVESLISKISGISGRKSSE